MYVSVYDSNNCLNKTVQVRHGVGKAYPADALYGDLTTDIEDTGHMLYRWMMEDGKVICGHYDLLERSSSNGFQLPSQAPETFEEYMKDRRDILLCILAKVVHIPSTSFPTYMRERDQGPMIHIPRRSTFSCLLMSPELLPRRK